MPLNPQIALSFRPPQQAFSPMRSMGDLLQLRQQRQQIDYYDTLNRDREQEIRQRQRVMSGDEAVARTYQRLASQPNAADQDGLPLVYSIADDVERQGYWEHATQLRQDATKAAKAQADMLDQQINVVNKQIKLTAQLLQGIKPPQEHEDATASVLSARALGGLGAPETTGTSAAPRGKRDPEAYQRDREAASKVYDKLLPTLRETAGEIFTPYLPKEGEYDPAAIERLVTQGIGLSAVLEQRQKAIQLAKDGLDIEKDARERDEYFTKALGTWLATADSQEEWDDAQRGIKRLGGHDVTLGKFGSTFSADAVERARTLAAGVGKIGSFEDFVTRAVNERTQAGQAKRLTSRELLGLRRQWDEVLDKLPSGEPRTVNFGSYFQKWLQEKGKTDWTSSDYLEARKDWGRDSVSASQRSIAGRWRKDKLDELDNLYGGERGGAGVESADQPEYRSRALELENEYRSLLGFAPLDRLPDDFFTPGKRRSTVPISEPKSGARAQPTSLEPPAPPEPVPAAVVAAMRGVPPGKRVRLSDDTVWRRRADGRIERVPSRPAGR